MQDKELHRLIDRYLSGQATDQETQTLMRWYRDQLQEDAVWESDHPGEANQVKARMEKKIRLKIQGQPSRSETVVRKLHWGWASAVVAAGLIGALLLFNARQTKEQPLSLAESPVLTAVDIQQDADENRFVLLPDSSKVILRSGSKLEYITDFQGKTREVALIGEGYFDIKRDEERPFIVHSGGIRTVVLGTAFTIKAEEGQEEVQVTVQHGRVRVEKQDKVLAELVANQQLEVDTRMAVTEQKNVVAEETLAWTAEGMRFDDEAFGKLINRLQRRYGIEITFKNPDLASCPVSGRFTGAETLDEVLELLCATRSATFVKTDQGRIEINGSGCH